MIAAVAPAAPTNVVATPTGGGRVTVTWDPPADTGGAPLTQFGVRVDGKRVALPAGARSAVVSGVRAGPREAKVRAFNQVAVSAWTRCRSPCRRTRRSTDRPGSARAPRSRCGFAGLLPNQPATLRVRCVKSGKLTTRTVDPRNDGTATLRLRVRKTVRVVADQRRHRSAVHRIRVP